MVGIKSVSISKCNVRGNLDLFFNVTSATVMLINDNLISGQIPTALAPNYELKVLAAQSNNISGTIPESLTSLKALEVMYFNNNPLLHGELPSRLWKMKDSMLRIDISDNPKLVGDLFGTVFLWHKLQSLMSRNCSFSGTMPRDIDSMRGLQTVDISLNDFSGTIPDGITMLDDLAYLNITNTKFTGTLPEKLKEKIANDKLLLNSKNTGIIGGD
jgi:hypothetical protein